MIDFNLRLPAALLFGLGLSGCAAVGSVTDEARAPGGMFNPGNYASSHGLVESSPMRRGGRPVAALPASAGRVVDVREKRMGNGFMQEIVLAADSGVRGENMIVVYVRDQPHPPVGEQEIEFPKDREDDLAAEVEKRFPGGALRFTDTLLRNTYGPYGVAVGRLGAANCVFFWQTLNDLKPYIRTARFSPYKIETATRVRLCRSGVDAATLTRWAAAIALDTGGVSEAPLAASDAPQGDPLADALDSRGGGGRGARTERYSGYATPAATSFAQDEAPRRVVRYAAPRRRHVVRYVRVRRAPARVEQDYAAQPAAPQTYAAQPYGQAVAAPPAYAAGYAQPGQVVWTQPGAAAIAQSAAPAYGAAPAAAAAGSVGLPPQAFSGPGAKGWVAAPR